MKISNFSHKRELEVRAGVRASKEDQQSGVWAMHGLYQCESLKFVCLCAISSQEEVNHIYVCDSVIYIGV